MSASTNSMKASLDYNWSCSVIPSSFHGSRSSQSRETWNFTLCIVFRILLFRMDVVLLLCNVEIQPWNWNSRFSHPPQLRGANLLWTDIKAAPWFLQLFAVIILVSLVKPWTPVHVLCLVKVHCFCFIINGISSILSPITIRILSVKIATVIHNSLSTLM